MAVKFLSVKCLNGTLLVVELTNGKVVTLTTDQISQGAPLQWYQPPPAARLN